MSSARISTSSSSLTIVGCNEGWDDTRELGPEEGCEEGDRRELGSEEGCDEEGDRRELCSEGELLSCEDGSEEDWVWKLGIDEASAGDADGLFSRMRLLSFPPPRSEVDALTDSAHKMMARKHDARIVVAWDSCILMMKRVYVMLLGLHFLCDVLRSIANSITQAITQATNLCYFWATLILSIICVSLNILIPLVQTRYDT